MATVPRLLTYEEWLRMPPVEDGTDEVVKGELRFMPPTQYPHAEIVRRLVRQIERQVDEKDVLVFGSNFGLMISREPLTCRSPDIALYSPDKLVIQDGLYYSPPGLIVEVLSPSENKRRKQEKLDDYASIGVPEAWIVSPEAQSIEVRLFNNGRLALSKIVIEGEMRPTQFSSVSIPVENIWPD